MRSAAFASTADANGYRTADPVFEEVNRRVLKVHATGGIVPREAMCMVAVVRLIKGNRRAPDEVSVTDGSRGAGRCP
jgi:hypothetical protein